jgi:hypothetical protein
MRTIAILLIVMLSVPTLSWARQHVADAAAEAKAWQQTAAAIPPGSRVKLQLTSGRRMTATLMSADGEGILVKRATRVPEPAVAIRYDELARLERDQGGGIGVGKAIGIGLSVGAGAILTLFAIAFAIDD